MKFKIKLSRTGYPKAEEDNIIIDLGLVNNARYLASENWIQ